MLKIKKALSRCKTCLESFDRVSVVAHCTEEEVTSLSLEISNGGGDGVHSDGVDMKPASHTQQSCSEQVGR